MEPRRTPREHAMTIAQPADFPMRLDQPERAPGLARVLAAACLTLTLAAASPSPAQSTGLPRISSSEAAFLKQDDAAMSKMTAGMDIEPSGDIDRDFVNMMVPHHQGAIDMAIAVLRWGRNPQIRRLAQEIIVDQLQEIAAMRRAVGEPLPASTPAPTLPPGSPLGPK